MEALGAVGLQASLLASAKTTKGTFAKNYHKWHTEVKKDEIEAAIEEAFKVRPRLASFLVGGKAMPHVST